jgi:hypothetical protein
MSYENGTMLYTIGLAGIGTFSVVNPRGWPIFLLAGASVSNPGEMDKAAREWKSVAADFDGLANELTTLANSVPEDKWTAEDRKAFEAGVAAFKTELKKSGETHNGVGDSMDGLAALYYAFAVIVCAVGSILAALMAVVLAAMATGIGAGPAQAAASTIAAGLQKVVELAQRKKLLALGVAGALFYAVQMWNQGKQTDLQQKGMNSTGGGSPMFTQATLTLGNPGLPAVPKVTGG